MSTSAHPQVIHCARLLSRLVATWFGVGYFPLGPGTLASAVALCMAYAVRMVVHTHASAFLFWGLFLSVPAIGAADDLARQENKKDPQIVVVDEVAGQLIALSGAATLRHLHIWVAAFVLFRFFDIVKPFPIRRIEKLPGGVGIVLDDVMAGIYCAVILFIAGRFGIY